MNANREVASSAEEFVPQSDEEARQILTDIAEMQRERSGLQSEHDALIQEVQSDLAASMAPLNTKIAAKVKCLQRYCAAHRDRLTDNGKKKTINFGPGTAQWKKKPDSIEVSDIEDVINNIKEQESLSFALKETVTLDKAVIKNHWDKFEGIEGLALVNGSEIFSIKPTATKIEEKAT